MNHEEQFHQNETTLQDVYELWEKKALALCYSPVTIRNTAAHLRMIARFLSERTPVKKINADMYYTLIADCRAHGYSEETLHVLNATLRKLIRLAHQRGLLQENVPDVWENMRTTRHRKHALVPPEHYEQIDAYFRTHTVPRGGDDHALRWRLLFSLLYHTGMRIGEALALTAGDFRTEPDDAAHGCEPGKPDIQISVVISKSYVSDLKMTKETKNLKIRSVPLVTHTGKLLERVNGAGSMIDRRLFPWTARACNNMLRTLCSRIGLPVYTCHIFRHTFISNLIARGVPLPVVEHASGDTQETILTRYSHMFRHDASLIRAAMEKG